MTTGALLQNSKINSSVAHTTTLLPALYLTSEFVALFVAHKALSAGPATWSPAPGVTYTLCALCTALAAGKLFEHHLNCRPGYLGRRSG
jgi:hypothetical protein